MSRSGDGVPRAHFVPALPRAETLLLVRGSLIQSKASFLQAEEKRVIWAMAMRALLHPPSSHPFLLCNPKIAAVAAAGFPLHVQHLVSHRRNPIPSLRCQASTTTLQSSTYELKEQGKPETLEYRVFFFDPAGKKVSPWHDIPLHAGDGLFNFVVEIPKESSAKMEVATEEPHTPIKQDTKKGKLRFYPYNINWNYGLLPQTWEDPSHSNAEVEGAFGDNDPVDVVEIGERRAEIGEVLKVKPLAVLAMIDEGELDWKVIAISANDPKASLVNDADDVEKHFPGTLTAIRDWFRDYKIPDGKSANKFGLGNKAAGKDYALKVIAETNKFWSSLVTRSSPAGDLSLL